MVLDPRTGHADALSPFPPGALLTLSHGKLEVVVAPSAGGRIAQINRDGVQQLVGYDDSNTAMIGWGCFPLVPWAGRIRQGQFDFGGRHYQLPRNLGAHAIHGVGFAMPWQVELQRPHLLELSLALPQDDTWPFGGTAYQRLELGEDRLEMLLSVQAGSFAMPASIGWHPWFQKPDRLHFSPTGFYPRDAEGIATLPLVPPRAGPWDDCFTNTESVLLERAGQQLHLSSDCAHWVVFNEKAHTTCVEPQSGPPDAFNIQPVILSPGTSLSKHFRMTWNDA